MTSVGYGDILPVNNLEKLFGTFHAFSLQFQNLSNHKNKTVPVIEKHENPNPLQ
jgi:hypothetical protein